MSASSRPSPDHLDLTSTTITGNVQEAKTRLSELLAQVESGEEVVIARRGTPVATLVAKQPWRRPMGFVEGSVPDSFFDPLPREELDRWNGIATKHRTGKLDTAHAVVAAYPDHVARLGAQDLAVSARHALLGGGMAWEHQDPFDRLIGAQAITESLPLVTADPVFAGLGGVRVLW